MLSFHVCPKSACRSCICRGLEACLHGLPPFFVFLCGLFYNSLLTLGAGLPLILGFTLLLAHFLIVTMSCHIILSFLLQWLNPFGPAVYSFPNGLTRPWAFLLMGSCIPFVFPWASLAHLLALGFLDPFTNFVFPWAFTDFIGFPQPNYFILIFGVYGPINPNSFCLHCFGPATAHSYFFSHHMLPMGLLLAISFFLGSFGPTCFLKAHLLISWTCDLLFLPLGLNGFSFLSLANFFSVYVARLGFLSFIWVSQKKTLNI